MVGLNEIDRADEYLARAKAATTDPVEVLMLSGQAYIELLIDNPSLAQFLASPLTMPDNPEIRSRVRDRIQGFHDELAAKIDACIAAGRFRQTDSSESRWVRSARLNGRARKPDLARRSVDDVDDTIVLLTVLTKGPG